MKRLIALLSVTVLFLSACECKCECVKALPVAEEQVASTPRAVQTAPSADSQIMIEDFRSLEQEILQAYEAGKEVASYFYNKEIADYEIDRLTRKILNEADVQIEQMTIHNTVFYKLGEENVLMQPVTLELALTDEQLLPITAYVNGLEKATFLKATDSETVEILYFVVQGLDIPTFDYEERFASWSEERKQSELERLSEIRDNLVKYREATERVLEVFEAKYRNYNHTPVYQELSDHLICDELLDAQNRFIPSVYGYLRGDISERMYLERADFNHPFADNPTAVSYIVEIKTDYDYSEPFTLSFCYADTPYADDNDRHKNLFLFTYTDDLELFDSEVDHDNFTVSAEIAGSGNYFVLDLDEFLKSIGIDVFANLSDDYS
jgi:hypothetical protein